MMWTRLTAARPAGRWIASLLCALALAGCTSAPAQERSDSAPGSHPGEASLRATLDKHLAAINARDLEALMSTVTQGDKLTTLLPSGKVLTRRDEYHQLHVDWFKQTDWRMVFDVQDIGHYGDIGIARVRYDGQSNADGGGYVSKLDAYLTLVFERQSDGWRLVYDQNTVVPGNVVPPAAD